MRSRIHPRFFWNAFLCAAALCLLPIQEFAVGLPEKLRAVSIKIDDKFADRTRSMEELRTLFEKAEPDIVSLQGAIDWDLCETISKLRPGLRVLTCSAFTGAPGKTVAQTAILARDRAVLSWVQEAPNGGCFAFAIVQSGTHRLGIFSLQPPASAHSGFDEFHARVMAEMKKVAAFPKNGPDAFLLAGITSNQTNRITEPELEFIAADAPPAIGANAEFELSNAGFLARPRIVPLSFNKTGAGLCDFQVGNPASTKFAYQTTLLLPGETPAQVEAMIHPPSTISDHPQMIGYLGGALLLLLFIGILSFRKKAVPGNQLIPLGHTPSELLAAHANEEVVRRGLLEWVKSHFMQRLLSQRQQMITSQTDATRRTLVIEEKLSLLQAALQERISAYENRISRLENELSAATTENRDLIRSQIDLLKEKLAKAKEEHSFRRN